jgi:hypothetical protein
MNYFNEYETCLAYYKKLLKELNLSPDQIPSSIVFGKNLKMDDLWYTRKRLMNLEFLILKQKQNTT